ncbi:hypothetical protein [Dactylosporangium salmoneum]|uniref:hypothetical protein n=1 Tax=Dactylosporangium salmoneum TaxID=53361 RepID=UPI0031E08345
MRRLGSRTLSRTSLAAALTVGAWLVLAPSPPGTPAATPSLPSLRTAWPAAAVIDTPARLADGTDFLPLLYVTPDVSLGTAPTPDHAAQRLLLRTTAGERELRRVDATLYPQFFGFTHTADHVYWAESTTAAATETGFWRAPLSPDGAATQIVPPGDVGAATFFGSEDDLVIADDHLYWAATGTTTTRDAGAVTEIRSVPIGGGAVGVRRLDGEYRLSTWPWARTIPGVKGPQQLLDLETGARRTVVGAAAEQLACEPVWCRAVVTTGSDQVALYDMVRTDGTDRRRIGAGTVTAAVPDVARLDRFEPLLQAQDPAAASSPWRLVLYDLVRDRTVAITDGVGAVRANQNMLWWQTRSGGAVQWHSLDLTTLT